MLVIKHTWVVGERSTVGKLGLSMVLKNSGTRMNITGTPNKKMINCTYISLLVYAMFICIQYE